MILQPSISILAGFLFVLDMDYPHEESVEEFICLADVNNCSDLSRVFDLAIRPSFLEYSEADRNWVIESIEYLLDKGESFESVFKKRSFLFSDEIHDGSLFMSILLVRLKVYRHEISEG